VLFCLVVGTLPIVAPLAFRALVWIAFLAFGWDAAELPVDREPSTDVSPVPSAGYPSPVLRAPRVAGRYVAVRYSPAADTLATASYLDRFGTAPTVE
jgi:hypothetical protein